MCFTPQWWNSWLCQQPVLQRRPKLNFHPGNNRDWFLSCSKNLIALLSSRPICWAVEKSLFHEGISFHRFKMQFKAITGYWAIFHIFFFRWGNCHPQRLEGWPAGNWVEPDPSTPGTCPGLLPLHHVSLVHSPTSTSFPHHWWTCNDLLLGSFRKSSIYSFSLIPGLHGFLFQAEPLGWERMRHH